MSYIQINEKLEMKCNHPLVDKIWLLGSANEDNTIRLAVNITTTENNHFLIESNTIESVIEKTENYLQTLNH